MHLGEVLAVPRERERERERGERGEGEGVCTREERGGCLWWVVVIHNHAPLRSLR